MTNTCCCNDLFAWIFCVDLNLVWGKKVRVANMLPAVKDETACVALLMKWYQEKVNNMG